MRTAVKATIIIAAALMLMGCGTPIYSGRLGEDEYWLSATSPGGMYGAFFLGAVPSETALPEKATEMCPRGYDKLSEQRGNFEGPYIRWEIHCRARG
jgi:hypothetical protein